jgi:hypothetical protein
MPKWEPTIPTTRGQWAGMDVVKGTTMVNANNNNLVISGTIFPQNIHKLSWLSPDGRTINQIDHIIINGKW